MWDTRTTYQNIENVLVSEACLFCLLLSFLQRMFFDWWSWFENLRTSEACVLPACSGLIYAHDIENVLVSVACLFCLLLSWGDFFQRTFWLIVIMRRFRPVKLVFACHCMICAHDVEDVFWGMFYAFCCHEAILLKIDWWSRYKLFFLVELLICLNNDFAFKFFFSGHWILWLLLLLLC